MDEPIICDRIVASGSDPSDRTITFALGLRGDERAIRVDITLGLVGPLMAVIEAEARKLNAGLSEDERAQSSTLNASAAWLSQDNQGRPMLVFELANGSLLPLAIEGGDFAGLAAEMALLAAKSDGPHH